MSDWLYYSLLSLIQGLTEFLPISSSAHLVLFPLLTDHSDQGLAFDVAIHLGTLVAVVFYFRRTIKWLWFGFWRSFNPQKRNGYYCQLAWQIIIASAPIAIVGACLHDQIEEITRSPIVIAYASIFFGLLLLLSDLMRKRMKPRRKTTFKSAIVIGLFQVLALIPGTSRSGITLTGGLFMGLTRQKAAAFSFLLAIPTILMAGGYESLKLVNQPSTVAWHFFILGFGISTVTAFWCIHLFLKLIDRLGLLPFVLYRVFLGIALLAVFHT